MQIIEFKPLVKGALVGFASVQMPSGLLFHECSILVTNGHYWASPPSKPRIGRDGSVMNGDGGKTLYTPIVEFVSKDARNRWSDAVIAALRVSNPEVFGS